MKDVFTTSNGRQTIMIIDHDTKVALQHVSIDRLADGTWKLIRKRKGGGETFIATDLADAFAIIFAAYDTLGMPRSLIVDNARELRRLSNTDEAKSAQCGVVAPGGEVRCSLSLGHDGEHAHESWSWDDAKDLSAAARALRNDLPKIAKGRAKRKSKRRSTKAKGR